MRTAVYKIIVLVWFILASNGIANAHGGEDHSADKKKTGTATTYFSTENNSAIYEVLIKYGELNKNEDGHLILYLSNVNTNKPVSGAKLQITNTDDDKQKIEVVEKDSGIYELETKFSAEKNYSFNIVINGGIGADLIQLSNIEVGKKLEVPHVESIQKSNSFFSLSNIMTIGIALLLGLLLGLLVKRRTLAGRKTISLVLILVLTTSPLSNFNANAHGGEDHGDNKESNNSGSAQILVPKETQFLFDVTTEKLKIGNFTPSINLFGTILPTSSGKAVVQTPQTGVIRSLNITVGQNVIKGQLLATVEQNIDAGTQLSWLTQKNTLEAEVIAAKKEFDRLKTIADITAKRDVDEAERRYNTAVNNLKLFQRSGGGSNKLINLFSPITGKIENFNFSIGATVSAGQDIFTITNLTKLYVEAQVFDKDADAVKMGKEFLVECTDDHRTQKVKLLTMAQSINTTNQSQKVLFEMDNEKGDFKIGEFVNVRVFNESNSRNIAIPNSAVTEVNGKSAVFIKDAAEKYTLRYVSLGENNGQFTTIIKGIKEDEKVVINGTYQLKMMYLNQ
ncbi:MAG: efflux RND transporter periplasmic adaptor subunit [Bacteroidia bacterium]